MNPKRADIERKMKMLGHTVNNWETVSSNVFLNECTKCGYYAMYEEITNDTTMIGAAITFACPIHNELTK